MNVFGCFFRWSKATELNVSATSDTVISGANETVDVLSEKTMVGGILSVGR